MVWVHGGMHDFWDERMLPFVREAVERGYIIIAPDYRGSSGYGSKLFDAADYGGRELGDVLEAAKYLRSLPYVDAARIGIMGWSHGGLIALLLLCRSQTPFVAGAAIVPVSDLIFRSAFKGPRYQRDIAPQGGLHGLPFQNRQAYVARSPALQVDNLQTPVLVHVATNDEDVDYVESRRLIDALLARKPSLAEVRVYDDVYVDMFGDAHSFSRRVNPITLTREDSPEQRDSWNRTWTFFEWWLRPYQDRSR